METNPTEKLEEVLESFGQNTNYVWDVLQEYLENPNSVNEPWKNLFDEIVETHSISSLKEMAQNRKTPNFYNGNSNGHHTTEKISSTSSTIQQNAKAISGVAAKIVENMEASLSIPTATSLRTIPVKILDENRQLINKYLTTNSKPKISYTHIIAWAIVKALAKFPSINTSFARVNGEPYKDEKPEINIGIAVDVTKKDGSRSLLVPNIKSANVMNFEEFFHAYDSIIQKARKASLAPTDFQSTTITLTNPGTVGTVSSTPRLMPGQGAIIATGSIGYDAAHQTVSPEILSALGISKVMTMTCTYDHRVIQGAESGQFLAYIHTLLLGEENFYMQIFSDLKIPFAPFQFSANTNSFSLPISTSQSSSEGAEKQSNVTQLINAYRSYGHLTAQLNPLQRNTTSHPELELSYHGLTSSDLDKEFFFTNKKIVLRKIIEILQNIYCNFVGVEYMHIYTSTERNWLQQKIETPQTPLSENRRKYIFKKLVEAESFENYLHTKFIGQKRFSLEGGESMMPMLDTILDGLAENGTQKVFIGMAHRGRLNVLANTIRKAVTKIFAEFEGNIDKKTMQGSGDVKYHLGAEGTYHSLQGKDISVEVACNPSHLEAVNPVVEGMVKALQEQNNDSEKKIFVPILIHGDAAFVGQGVVAETLSFSQLEGYGTGGTIHIVINNQIGFTTSPKDARSSSYCTDIAKIINAPIFHVNGDEPESAVQIATLALAYKNEFKKDVVIDLVCYRKYGHNEGDEPSYTQPLLYKKIKEHTPVSEQYTKKLIEEKFISQEEVQQFKEETKKRFDDAYEEIHNKVVSFPSTAKKEILPPRSTTISSELLQSIVEKLGTVPENFSLHPKLVKMLEQRKHFTLNDAKIDWALAETLAFGSLVCENVPVRLSGEDCERGTFSHRHAVLYDVTNGNKYIPLNNLQTSQAKFTVHNSLLSEFAVLGFDYGYSVAAQNSLVLWEAQFGDFVNGAQITIDQFLSAGEQKWQQNSNLVLLLPHGYEGQGPEHSSSRVERFLQLCAEENMQVCNLTTPAQYFHVLRRQMYGGKRKPLIITTPKSLLRHPLVISSINDFTKNSFQEILDDTRSLNNVQRVILCNGKVFYDVWKSINEKNINTIAVVRIEQLYPYPQQQLQNIFKKYSTAKEIVWLQEEPKNMGAWNFLQSQLQEDILPTQKLRYVGRKPAASTAVGSHKQHEVEQESIIKEVIQ